MPTIPIIEIPGVGTVFQRLRGGWNWAHRDGTNTMADAVPGQNTLEWRWYDHNGNARWAIERYEPDGQPADFFTKRAALASLAYHHFQLGIPAAAGGDAA